MYIVITDLVKDGDATPRHYIPNPTYIGPFANYEDANEYVKKQPQQVDYYEFYYKIVSLRDPK